MDVQVGIIERVADQDALLTKIRAAIAAARGQKIPLIYVVVGFRDGAPEASDRFKPMAATLANPRPLLAPAEDDVVVVKRRVSAFSGSDLEVLLRAQNVRHLVLAGIATSGVVLSTVREAADKDFQITVLEDACADADAQVHALLMEKIFPRQCTVTTVENWSRTL